jgi:predicted secreted protein
MAVLAGNGGVIKIDASVGGSLTTVVNVRNFSIDITADTIETTVMTTDVRTYVKGMSSWSGSADVYFDATNFAAISALNPAVSSTSVGEATVSISAALDNTSHVFTGEIIVTGYSVSSSMDGLVEATISFQGSGALAFA